MKVSGIFRHEPFAASHKNQFCGGVRTADIVQELVMEENHASIRVADEEKKTHSDAAIRDGPGCHYRIFDYARTGGFRR